MSPIGGFFELELVKGSEHYPDLAALNTGRNALEYILRANSYSNVYIPRYTCDVILEPFKKLNIAYSFYDINERLEPAEPIETGENEAFLYTNYYGIKQDFIDHAAEKYTNLIIDNSQAFFSAPLENADTFYSCRKFFGVPDGAYVKLKSGKKAPEIHGVDKSSGRFSHLLGRIDDGPEAAYADFKSNDEALSGQPLLRMSELTRSLMRSIDYARIRERRNANFHLLHQALGKRNGLSAIIPADPSGPMVYPFLTENNELKSKLIRNKIFVASYWPNVKDWCAAGSLERKLYDNLLALPVDQRYSETEMNRVIKVVLE